MRIPTKVLRVLDGDTLQVMLRGVRETIRLHSIDTEESALGTGKPATAAGIKAKQWGQKWIPRDVELEGDRLDLDVAEQRDQYGRILAHIHIESQHLNHELIRLGYSPYFNKYGNSRRYHRQFTAAQDQAQDAGLCIWNPQTNRGGARRDYDKLLPWWESRAAALDMARSDLSILNLAENCDNVCRLISDYTAGEQKLFRSFVGGGGGFLGGEVMCVADFQNGLHKSYGRGVIMRSARRRSASLSRGPKSFLNIWFPLRQATNEAELVDHLHHFIQKQDYAFVSGTFSIYRKVPQLEVKAIASTPYDLG